MPLNLLVAELLRHGRRLKSHEARPCGPRADMGRPGALERALIPPAAPSEAAESTHISPSQMLQSPVCCSTDGETGGNDGKRRPTESDTGHRHQRSFTPQFGALPQLCCLRGKAALRDLQPQTEKLSKLDLFKSSKVFGSRGLTGSAG